MININDIYEVLDMYGEGLSEEEGYSAFINIKTGDVLTISDRILQMAKDRKGHEELSEWEDVDYEMASDVINNSDDFVEFPTGEFINEYEIMKEFCKIHKELLQDMKECDGERSLKSRIYNKGMQEQWYVYKDTVVLQQLREWCEEKGIEIE